MRTAILGLLVLASIGCKKQPDDGDTTLPTDYKAELADVVPGDFKELCTIRLVAPATSYPDIDAVAAKWKAASRDQMHANVKAAGTHPRLAQGLEALYDAPGEPCTRGVLFVTSAQTVSSYAEPKNLRGADFPEVVSAAQLTRRLAALAGPWIEVRAVEPKYATHLRIDTAIDGDYEHNVEIAGYQLPLLHSKSIAIVRTIKDGKGSEGDSVPLEMVTADLGQTIQYTVHKAIAGTDRSSAVRPTVGAMVASLTEKTYAQLDPTLGLVLDAPDLAPFVGAWKPVGDPTITNPCQGLTSRRQYSIELSDLRVEPHSRAMTINLHDEPPAGIENGKLVARTRLDGGCLYHKDRLEAVFDGKTATVTWMLGDDRTEPCAVCKVTVTATLAKGDAKP